MSDLRRRAIGAVADEKPQQIGRCWLGCGRTDIPVEWVGPVTIPAGTIPIFGCEDCRVRWHQWAWEEILNQDFADLTAR